MHQFRYSRSRFLTMMIASLALTAAITFTTYVLLSTFGVRQYTLVTYATGLIFFGFLSAGMIYRFLRKEIILSIHHGGILDVRHSPEVLAWDDIKAIVLEQVEQEQQLRVFFWQTNNGVRQMKVANAVINIELLDGDAASVVASIERYQPVVRVSGQAQFEEWQ